MHERGNARDRQSLTMVVPAAASLPVPMVESSTEDVAQSVASNKNSADARYSFNDERLAKLRSDSPWTTDTKYFTSVAISPSAIMKMVSVI
jgi:hypothetical protein